MGDELRWTLGDRLRKARRAAGLTHTDLAGALGVSAGSVSRFENDLQAPRAAYLLAWATRCGVELDWLNGDASTAWYLDSTTAQAAA